MDIIPQLSLTFFHAPLKSGGIREAESRAVRCGQKKLFLEFLFDFDFNHDFDTNRHALQLKMHSV